MQLESLYQEIILDHYRNPQNKGLREPFDAEVLHVGAADRFVAVSPLTNPT